MNILFDIGHPAHVHLIRNLYNCLQGKSDTIIITVKENLEMAQELLSYYDLPFIKIGSKSDSLFAKALKQIRFNFQIIQLVRKHNIELGIGTSITLAHVSRFTKMKSILLDDDDDDVQPLFTRFAHPFCDVLLSPSALKGHRKKKNTVFYEGYHELAYLHPKRFEPNPKVIADHGLNSTDRYFVLRFNSFKAHHDTNAQGLSIENKRKLIQLLEPHGHVFITTERNIDEEFKKYQLLIPPHEIHSFLYYATMFIGDSQTMTSEAAVLGVPSFRCNSFAGEISYLKELELKYGLTFSYVPSRFDSMKVKIENMLLMSGLKEEWQMKRQLMLNDKIDVTSFFEWFVGQYPKSINKVKDEESFWHHFK